jgi:hypothetical protein
MIIMTQISWKNPIAIVPYLISKQKQHRLRPFSVGGGKLSLASFLLPNIELDILLSLIFL